MKTKSILALIGLVALGVSARANSITPTTIIGDSNSLHAEFDVTWDSFPVSGSTKGTWSSGADQWRFGYYVVPGGDPIRDEGLCAFILSTAWDNGALNPGGFILFSDFIFPTSGGLSPVGFPNPIHFPVTDSHGITYLFTENGYGSFTAEEDHTGSAHAVFDISRVLVPETGSTLALFAGATWALLVGLRVFRRIEKKRDRGEK